jgi:glycosyltransferase involved in cell wall biosynthesis
VTRRILLITNVPLNDENSRGANFASRAKLLEDEGWETVEGLISPPYLRNFLPSLVRCLRIACGEDIDVVTSVNNPFHLHLVGFLITLLTGLPWVAEIRDPIVHNPSRDPNTVTTKLAKIVEWLVATYADLIVWGDGIQMEEDYFERTYDIKPERVWKLPYKGYQHDQFASADTASFDDFTVTYAGSFYEDWIEPYTVFKGIKHHVNTHDRDLTVQFYGDWKPEYDEAVTKAGINDIVEHREFVPKSELLPILKGSDALLYIGGTDPENRLNIPSKVYDYIGAKQPVLAVVDPSFRVAELVRKENIGVVAPYENHKAIADALTTLRTEDIFDPDENLYDRFDRQRKIEVLARAYANASEGSVKE